MSESKIRRKLKTYSFTSYSNTTSSIVYPCVDMAGGLLIAGSVNTAAVALNLFAADSTSGPWRQVYDSSGSAASITIATHATDGRAYQIPDAAFAAPYLQIVGSTTAATGMTGTVCFKG